MTERLGVSPAFQDILFFVVPVLFHHWEPHIIFSLHSSIAQSVEHAAVNRRVVGSSPTWGASKTPCSFNKEFFNYIRLRRVILLRSDIRLMPSDIVLRTVKEAYII